MHIWFAIWFFGVVALSETLRLGAFGLGVSASRDLVSGALVLAAVFILRADLMALVRRPTEALYGRAELNWSWSRTALGLLPAVAFLILPFVPALSLIQIKALPVPDAAMAETVLSQMLLVTLAQDLFFREAALKAFGSDLPSLLLASTLACFIFHLPLGPAMAGLAAATGLAMLTLRLIGTHIVVVALVHAALLVVLEQVIPAGLPGEETWRFVTWFTVGAVGLSLVSIKLFALKRSETRYA